MGDQGSCYKTESLTEINSTMTMFKLLKTLVSVSMIVGSSLAKAADTEETYSDSRSHHSSRSVEIAVSPVEYVDVNDPDFALLGFVSIPPNQIDNSGQLLPGVVIVPVSYISSPFMQRSSDQVDVVHSFVFQMPKSATVSRSCLLENLR